MDVATAIDSKCINPTNIYGAFDSLPSSITPDHSLFLFYLLAHGSFMQCRLLLVQYNTLTNISERLCVYWQLKRISQPVKPEQHIPYNRRTMPISCDLCTLVSDPSEGLQLPRKIPILRAIPSGLYRICRPQSSEQLQFKKSTCILRSSLGTL